MEDLREKGWSADKILDRAYEVVNDTDDISLVGLAVRLKDPIAMTALRESVVLYVETMELGYVKNPPVEFVWKVDDEFAETANCFIGEFNRLLPKGSYLSNGIPNAESKNAERFYWAFVDNEILGRCARLGYDRSTPINYYHWAITKQNEDLVLDEFWSRELWTTEQYRFEQERLGWKFLKDELVKRSKFNPQKNADGSKIAPPNGGGCNEKHDSHASP